MRQDLHMQKWISCPGFTAGATGIYAPESAH
jgi:hypothetical protein